MNLLESLLDAIVRLEGDALVMHVGEKPYVVTTSASMNAYRGPLAWGQVELSSRVLTSDAVLQMLTQILPPDQRHALDELGAIEHEIQRTNGSSERFVIVAARGGDDVWLEVRRRQPELAEGVEGAAPEPEPAAEPAPIGVSEFPSEAAAPSVHTPAPAVHETARLDAHAAEVGAIADAVTAEEVAPGIEHAAEPAGEGAREPLAEPLPPSVAEALAPGAYAEIEIVHEELQAVPTDDEVDAMLAATAAELLQGELPVGATVEIAEQEQAAESAPRADAASSFAAKDERVLEGAPPLPAVAHERVEPAAAIASEPELVAMEPEPFAAGPPVTEEPAVVAEAPSVVEEPSVDHVAARADVPAAPEPLVENAPAMPDFVKAATVSPAPDVPIAEPQPLSEASELVLEEREPVAAEVPEPPVPAEISPLAEIVAGAFAAEAAIAIERAVVPAGQEPAFSLTPPPDRDVEAAPPDATEAAVAVPEPSDPLPFEAHVDEGPPSVPERVEAEEELDARAASARTPAFEAPVARAADAREVRAETETPAVRTEMTETHTEPPAPRAVFVGPPRPTLVPPPTRAAAPPRVPPEGDGGITRILQSAAALGASIVYVVAQSRPMVRIDGEISTLEDEAVLDVDEVAAIVAHMDRVRGAAGETSIDAAEWMCDVRDVGRVRYLTFHDHRGPGIIFRMTPPRAISAEHLGLPAEVLALCAQPDGLVLVTGAHGSGKSTMLTAFLDLINRTRSDHVIAIESQIGFVHESQKSFVSQRELRGDSAAVAGAVRRALLEDPDVLFVEDLGSSDLVAGVLEAAESGRLVFASVQAPSATAALEQIVELFPTERRAQARTALAGSLRGVVAQVLLRKVKGGRIAAREVLLNSPAVASLILEGKMFQLPAALEGGRRHGMVPLTDALAGLVREGIVHVGEAYRKAVDRDALLAVLKREGVDTSFAERLA